MTILFQPLIGRGLVIDVAANDDCQLSKTQPFKSDHAKSNSIQKGSSGFIFIIYLYLTC